VDRVRWFGGTPSVAFRAARTNRTYKSYRTYKTYKSSEATTFPFPSDREAWP